MPSGKIHSNKLKNMKIFIYALMVLSIFLIGFNVAMLDFNDWSKEDNIIALIGIIASICAILILLIFKLSGKLADKLKE